MKQTLAGLTRRYATGLQKYLGGETPENLQAALKLGRTAVDLGMETLELARMHERALVTLGIADAKIRERKRSEVFFTGAITPVLENHHAARQSKIELNRLNETLGRRTVELAATNRLLQRGILRRKGVEAALKKSGAHYGKLLKDSLQLQEGLRHLTHQVLAAQEAERKKISCELQDEIAQTLLGINVRLVSLKAEAKTNTTGLKNEIASTRQLVVRSARSMRRVAREFRNA